MTKVYDQHDAAFREISAYVIAKGGERVATVALKFARSGLRTTAYVHWCGAEMQRGIANGGGYDKATAAVAHAAVKIPGLDVDPALSNADKAAAHRLCLRETFLKALRADTGLRWYDALRDAGFTVWQAV